jgi:uncharacterized protein YebE (UPF0316 family)
MPLKGSRQHFIRKEGCHMITTLLLIVVLQLVYVSMLTVRTILTIKGYQFMAALLSAVDVLVYVIGFKIVLDNLDQPINLIVYCVSYGVGLFLGMKLEEKLALGYLNISVITKKENVQLVQQLRNAGYGVTAWFGEGMEGERLVLSITAHRKQQNKLSKQISELDPNAFIVAYEPKHFQGGFSFQPFRRASNTLALSKKKKALQL